jgi:uncharacterized protein YhbP (UPF0306 family)
MQKINSEIIEFLSTQKTCVLAVQMPDGAPHAATVHFAFVGEPLTFIIMTNPESRKHEAFVGGKAKASLVVGTNFGDEKTFQMDGEVALSDNQEFLNLYHERFPKAAHVFKKDVLFTFTPTWWRYTDWGKEPEKRIITS